VTEASIHERYNEDYYNDYDVAVLRVCADFDIGMDISKYVKFLQ
jgi:hypothetical protein